MQGAQGRQLGQGAGLGLAIVQRYAQLLNAQFTLEPGAQGRGLSARLRFRV
jgi:two-component system, OmpR family, sensor histidine kinase TctE